MTDIKVCFAGGVDFIQKGVDFLNDVQVAICVAKIRRMLFGCRFAKVTFYVIKLSW